MMKAASSTGLFPTLTKDPLIMSAEERAKAKEAPFFDDPDPKNIEKMKELQQDYEAIKQVGKFFYMDMKASQYPSSAPGGRYWLEKGTVDSYNDMNHGTYKVKTVPYLVR